MRSGWVWVGAIGLGASACSATTDRGLERLAAATTTTVIPPTSVIEPPTSPPPLRSTEPLPTTASPPRWPALAAGGPAGAVVTPGGIVVPVVGQESDRYRVETPCGGTAAVSGTALAAAHVVLDPGHGGDEPGAVGPNGVTEAEVNLAVAEEARRILEASGATVVLTRTGEYRMTLQTRARIATNLSPHAFVSIHHNSEPDGPWPRPGSETYYQIANPNSKRLAGLLWEELVRAFSVFPGPWVADTDAGAKYRLNSKNTDYYGILRRTAGITSVLSEAAFVSNPAEAELLTPAFRQAEAQAIANALRRFVTTNDPGSGFTEPYPRSSPAGGGGGSGGCVDPPLE